jgi:hypothetical protein
MNILFIGDIVGKPGRDATLAHLPGLRHELACDLVVANAENAAGGWGITPPIARSLLEGGVDVITMGNHTWAKESGVDVLETHQRVLRPANYPPGTPGRGFGVFRTSGGVMVAVANLNGRALMEPLDCPFRVADEILVAIDGQAKVILFDFHAEATSEKAAFAHHCDGRVSAVLGTHTHVPTADERILPNGCAFITDVGMCGPYNSVIGMDVGTVLSRFRTQIPHKFRVAEGQSILGAVLIRVDPQTGRAEHIERIVRWH